MKSRTKSSAKTKFSGKACEQYRTSRETGRGVMNYDRLVSIRVRIYFFFYCRYYSCCSPYSYDCCSRRGRNVCNINKTNNGRGGGASEAPAMDISILNESLYTVRVYAINVYTRGTGRRFLLMAKKREKKRGIKKKATFAVLSPSHPVCPVRRAPRASYGSFVVVPAQRFSTLLLCTVF